MSNETEKLTINLGVVELSQIDVLVEQGVYSNRSDFIRTAIRKDLEFQREKIEHSLTPIAGSENKNRVTMIGIMYLSKRLLDDFFYDNNKEKIKISVIGMLKIDNDLSPELFKKTVASVDVRGKVIASPEIKKLIDEMK